MPSGAWPSTTRSSSAWPRSRGPSPAASPCRWRRPRRSAAWSGRTSAFPSWIPPGVWEHPRVPDDMPRRPRVLVMIMAGGRGERLHPLTRDRSKPAVPFGGRHRIVDFVLSSFVNSELLSLYVLVQYKSQSLIEHVRLAWRTNGFLPDHFIAVVPPQMR